MNDYKSGIFQMFFHRYLTLLLKWNFYHIYIEDLRRNKTSKGIYMFNHSSWWDGLLVFYLNYTYLKEDAYAFMSEDGLSKFPFFKKLGAFPVNSHSYKSVVKALQFGVDRIKEGKTVFIFPQGKEEHLEKRPLQFMSGLSYMIEKTPNVKIIPVTFYYTFRHDQKPELFIRIGEEWDETEEVADRKGLTYKLERLMEHEIDQVKNVIIQEDVKHYTSLVRGRLTVSEWMTVLKKPFNRGEK
ncbi:lysophospholipid acyltransferase family protein [Bacillus coahuilensis]|nr:lysophospholipid acyltransferase family protein [Bacillus coahuilensis]